MLIAKEKERIAEEKQIIEKRAKLEEESLRKRIKMHEEFNKQQETKSREKEENYRLEIEEINRKSDKKNGDLNLEIVIQKDKNGV